MPDVWTPEGAGDAGGPSDGPRLLLLPDIYDGVRFYLGEKRVSDAKRKKGKKPSCAQHTQWVLSGLRELRTNRPLIFVFLGKPQRKRACGFKLRAPHGDLFLDVNVVIRGENHPSLQSLVFSGSTNVYFQPEVLCLDSHFTV